MKKSATSKKWHTERRQGGARKDTRIDFSDIPELTPEMFARSVVRRGLKPVPSKAQITLRVDRDVLEWYRKQGPGYQSRINALLRAYFREYSKQTVKRSR
jgi:uncharacterized protein (DUF4415 family)